MSPWPPKMATGQKNVNKALDAFIACWGFSLPHFQGWQGHPTIIHHPRAPKYTPPPKKKKTLQPLALKLWLLDLQLLNLQLLDLHFLDLQPLAGPVDIGPPTPGRTCRYWTSSSWTSCLTAAQERDWLRAHLN